VYSFFLIFSITSLVALPTKQFHLLDHSIYFLSSRAVSASLQSDAEDVHWSPPKLRALLYNGPRKNVLNGSGDRLFLVLLQQALKPKSWKLDC